MSAKKPQTHKKSQPSKVKSAKKVNTIVVNNKKKSANKKVLSKSIKLKKSSTKKVASKPDKRVVIKKQSTAISKGKNASKKSVLNKVSKQEQKLKKSTKTVQQKIKKEKPLNKLKAKDSGKDKVKSLTKEKEKVKAKVKEGVEINNIKAEKTSTKSKRGRKKKKSGDDDDEPSIDVNDAFINEILATVKPNKKGPKVPKQIRTFVNPITSLTVAKDVKKGKAKEPKGKFELEYVLGTSPGILYEFLTTPSGLSEWFADDVNIHDGVFTFFWDGTEQKALLLDFKQDKFVRFQWVDKAEGAYFEFRIDVDELTGDVSLIVTDFADEGSDQQTSKLLWDSQIHTLMQVTGSY